jgi:hypothetical protein
MGWNITKAVQALRDNAEDSSTGHCAKYTADAIEAGGATLIRTVSAKDFGPALKAAAFLEVPVSPLGFKPGDVAVIQPYAGGSPHGHMAMFDGTAWYSDFKQNSMMCPPDPYPGLGYRKASPPYTVYRRFETP